MSRIIGNLAYPYADLVPSAQLENFLGDVSFESVKEILHDKRIAPFMKYVKKQIQDLDSNCNELRANIARAYKEEKTTDGLTQEQESLFQDLVLKEKYAHQIAEEFSAKWGDYDWSVFVHHVTGSDLCYCHDGYYEWIHKGLRYALIRTRP